MAARLRARCRAKAELMGVALELAEEAMGIMDLASIKGKAIRIFAKGVTCRLR